MDRHSHMPYQINSVKLYTFLPYCKIQPTQYLTSVSARFSQPAYFWHIAKCIPSDTSLDKYTCSSDSMYKCMHPLIILCTALKNASNTQNLMQMEHLPNATSVCKFGHTHRCTHTGAHTHICTHTHTHTHTHIRTHTYIHTYIHSYTHVHIYAYIYNVCWYWLENNLT